MIKRFVVLVFSSTLACGCSASPADGGTLAGPDLRAPADLAQPADLSVSSDLSMPDPLTVGLLGYWPMDGDANDRSTGGRNLGLIGTPGFAQGVLGQALDLHGNAAQYAVRPIDDGIFNFGASDFTIQVWVNYNQSASTQVIVEKFQGANGPGWTVAQFGGTLQFYASPSANIISAALNLSAGVWHHHLVRRAGDQFAFFLDGSVVISGTNGQPVPDTTFPLLVGRRNSADGRTLPVDGRVDELAIWGRALSDGEIASLYNGGQGRRPGL